MAKSKLKPPTQKLLSREAAAEASGLSMRTLDYAIKAGEIEAYRVGRRVLISRDSLFTFATRNRITTDTQQQPQSQFGAA